MMKRIICFFAVITCLSFSIAQELRSTETILQQNDSGYGQILKRINWIDKNNKTVKIENILTKEYSDKVGLVKQIDYLKEEVPYMFEMYNNESLVKDTGIKIRRDYVDNNDVIQKAQLEFSNNLVWEVGKEDVAFLNKFPVLNFSVYTAPYEETTSSGRILETRISKGTTYFVGFTSVDSIDTETKELVDWWKKTFSIKADFNKKLEFNYGNLKCFLVIEKQFPEINNLKNTLIAYYYIGGYNNKPVFVLRKVFKNEALKK